MAKPSANARFLYISLGVGIFLIMLLLGYHRDTVTEHVTRPFKSSANVSSNTTETANGCGFRAKGEKVAYATWYSSAVNSDEDYSSDKYFIATRMLAYQIMHDPETKTRCDVPFIILCTPDVTKSRKDRLRKDGAIIKEIDWLTTDNEWYHEGRPNWHGIMSKLYIYEMTEYNRVLLIDGDTVMHKPLDGIFDDPGTQLVKTNFSAGLKPEDEGEMPEEYLLAAVGEVGHPEHEFPPADGDFIDPEMFCAGFFMMHPDPKMLAYLKSVMVINNRWRPDLMEQALLNYVHRQGGPMPWMYHGREWNIREPTWNDYEHGLVSAHWKWWELPSSREGQVRDWMYEVRWKMEGYYQAYDEYKKSFF